MLAHNSYDTGPWRSDIDILRKWKHAHLCNFGWFASFSHKSRYTDTRQFPHFRPSKTSHDVLTFSHVFPSRQQHILTKSTFAKMVHPCIRQRQTSWPSGAPHLAIEDLALQAEWGLAKLPIVKSQASNVNKMWMSCLSFIYCAWGETGEMGWWGWWSHHHDPEIYVSYLQYKEVPTQVNTAPTSHVT